MIQTIIGTLTIALVVLAAVSALDPNSISDVSEETRFKGRKGGKGKGKGWGGGHGGGHGGGGDIGIGGDGPFSQQYHYTSYGGQGGHGAGHGGGLGWGGGQTIHLAPAHGLGTGLMGIFAAGLIGLLLACVLNGKGGSSGGGGGWDSAGSSGWKRSYDVAGTAEKVLSSIQKVYGDYRKNQTKVN